jgi:DtxR family Mn-dependent transcriptional regulator
MATPTVENYLKVIEALCRESGNGQATVAGIAASLGVTKGSVSTMVRKLGGSGHVLSEPYGGIRLSARGRKMACDVLRRHRLVELFLVDVVGLDWSEVHAEAERLEHAISPRLLDRIDEMLGRPKYDPHGDPIPDASGQSERTHLVPLSACGAGDKVIIGRISDQASDFLKFVDRTGLRPGAAVMVERVDPLAGAIVLKPKGHPSVTVSYSVAAKVLARTRRALSA